jgi:hypothetical protein
MSGRVDLDAVMADYEAARQAAWSGSITPLVELAKQVPALVAELGAAREVVDAARRVSHSPEVIGHTEDAAQRVFNLDQAVRIYDQHVQPPPGTKEARP